MATCGGVLVFLTGTVGVHCPHGSELPGDDPMLCCWYVFWASAVCCELADATGLNVDVGLGMNPEVEGIGVLGKGYIPGHRNCLLMRSASLVTLTDGDSIVQLRKKLYVIICPETIDGREFF